MAGTYKEHLYALIVCGGVGTRLWPRSRQKTPKQFLEKFYGEKTLFSQTAERAKLLTTNDKIFVITLADYVDEILQQSPDILAKNIITEPFGKNTAMAVGVGAAFIKKVDPEAVIMNFWSDAAIRENDLFVEKLSLAAEAAFSGNYLVVVGLKPTFPHTGLGYIETGEMTDINNSVWKVNSFEEKPDLETAKQFLEKGNYYWNIGIYVWSAKSIFEAFSRSSPTIFTLLERVFNGIGTADEREIIVKAYGEVENTSIDVAVSEKADNLLLVSASFPWSDIGSWKVTYDLGEKDAEGNVVTIFGKGGEYLGVDTKNCLIQAGSRLIATIGLSDLFIVDTPWGLLVGQLDRAQEVKEVVNRLKAGGRKEVL